jgi:carbon starvation protein
MEIVIASALVLIAAYWLYGGWLSRVLRLDNRQPTPAVEFKDSLEFDPAPARFLLGQHFSAIAAAGPIVGPIMAGITFGWLPALIWILVGSIFIGGVHDLTALVASVRHRARSVTEVVRNHISGRAFLLFLMFVWIALVYIIVAFTDITARAFVGTQKMENGQEISGPGIAMSSVLYLVLPVIMGWMMRRIRLSLTWATLIFVPLVGLAIWAGQLLPLDMGAWLGWSEAMTVKVWCTLLLGYCLVAAVVPVWLLLQPRGYLGGVFLYLALAGGMLGLLLGGAPVRYPAFTDWTSPRGETLFPFLFITIACGACSGFHALICSGTTSKQLAKTTDARVIGYGAMLMEGMVAVVSLCCVMMLASQSEILKNPKPNLIYATGIGGFLETLGIPARFGVAFALMAFTTFVYDTLDVCARLGRFIIQELTGLHGRIGRWLGTCSTAGVPLFFLWTAGIDSNGKPVEVWRVFWSLFGASNQLLAALTLLGITVWMWRTRRAAWVWPVLGIPTVFMYCMSTWALGSMTISGFAGADGWNLPTSPVPWVGLILLGLAAWMLLEALIALLKPLQMGADLAPVFSGDV